MATSTPNYNLRKPADTDFVTVAADIAANMDTIDTQIKNRKDEVTALQGRATTLESRANGHDTDVNGLKSRATAVENRATSLEGRATALENTTAALSPNYIIMVGNAATTVPNTTRTQIAIVQQETSGPGLQGNASAVKIGTSVDNGPGVYYVSAMIDWNANTTGERVLSVLKNGAQTALADLRPAGMSGSADGGTHRQNVSGLLRVAANDVITIAGWQNSGGNLSTDGGATGAYLHMFRIA